VQTTRIAVQICFAELKAGFFVKAATAPSSSAGLTTVALALSVEVQECPEGSYQPYEGEDPVYNCTSCGVGLKTDGTGSISSEACCECGCLDTAAVRVLLNLVPAVLL
jgi:hypothetical protein